MAHNASGALYVCSEGSRGCCCQQRAQVTFMTRAVYPKSHQYLSWLSRIRCGRLPSYEKSTPRHNRVARSPGHRVSLNDILCRPGRRRPQSDYHAKVGRNSEQKRLPIRLNSCDHLQVGTASQVRKMAGHICWRLPR